MKVLVTGGLGAVGSWFTRLLVERDVPHLVVGRQPRRDLVADVWRDVHFASADILDWPHLATLARGGGFTHVVHLAATVAQAEARPHWTIRNNAVGTANVLELARLLGIPNVVYASSSTVYGLSHGVHGHPEYTPIPESHPLDPLGSYAPVYAITKLFGEQLCLSGARAGQFNATVLRFGPTLGPGELEGHALLACHRKLIEDAMAARPCRLPRGGDQRTDIVYVKDVARAVFLACAQNPGAPLTLNVASGRATSLSEWAEAVSAHLPGARIELGPGLDYLGLPGVYRAFDVSRARQELGFVPEYDVAAAVREYVEAYRRLGLAYQPIEVRP